MDPEETKQMFKKFFIQSFLLHKKKSGLKLDTDDLIEIIKNLSNSEIIDEITNRLTGKVMRRLSETLIAKSQTDFSGNEQAEASLERIEVLLGHPPHKQAGRGGAGGSAGHHATDNINKKRKHTDKNNAKMSGTEIKGVKNGTKVKAGKNEIETKDGKKETEVKVEQNETEAKGEKKSKGKKGKKGKGKKGKGKKGKGKKGKGKSSAETEEVGLPIMINGKFYRK